MIVKSQNDFHVAITEEATLHTSQGRAVLVFFYLLKEKQSH